MGVNISGSGILSGIASLVMGAVNNLNLLVTRIIGYTSTGGGGSSYYTTMVGSTGSGYVAVSQGKFAYSLDSISWTTLDVSGNYLSVAYGNNMFVAVGNNVKAYSTDGVNWNVVNTNGFQSSVIYFANKFISVGNAVEYSTDGINWTTSFTEYYYYESLYIFKNTAIALSDRKRAYSTDGINWTVETHLGGQEISNAKHWAASFNENRFFYVVGPTFESSLRHAVYTTDGVTWSTQTTTGLPSNLTFEDTASGNGMHVGYLNSQWLYAYSTDAINWTTVGSEQDPYFAGIAYGSNKFVMLTNSVSGIMAKYSTDGINWTTVTLSETWIDSPQIKYVNDKFIVHTFPGPSNLSTFFVSSDGINWESSVVPAPYLGYRGFTYGTLSTLVETQISIGDQGSGGAEILAPVDVYTVPPIKTTSIDQVTIKNNSNNTITYDLAVLDPGLTLTDQNATINDQAVLAGATATITNITTPMTLGQRIVVFPSAVDVVEVKVYGTETQGSAFHAVATGSIASAYSVDAINWYQTNLSSASDWSGLFHGNGKFVAVATNSNMSAYSTDGLAWTQTTLPSTQNWRQITYGNNKFVAVAGDSNIAAYSTDGITWTQTTLSSYQQWRYISYGNGKFVAVATGSNISAYSTDGITWTQNTLPSSQPWKSMTYADGKFVILAENVAVYSTDGIAWTQTTLPSTQDWYSVTYGNGKFVAVAGDSNIAIYSTDGITWNQTTLPSSRIWYRVTYGNGKFAAVAYNSGVSAYSADGINWTEASLPLNQSWSSITYG